MYICLYLTSFSGAMFHIFTRLNAYQRPKMSNFSLQNLIGRFPNNIFINLKPDTEDRNIFVVCPLISCCCLSFDHCVVCPSFMDSDYSFGIFKLFLFRYLFSFISKVIIDLNYSKKKLL